ncbi:hypothetical protein HRbin09_00838 [bacterium HR09]|nr:hypothetical protein HRbin09_00838 [bacterium HR09]
MKVLAIVFGGVLLAALAASQQALTYKADVEPIFVKECAECHGGERPKKGLDLAAGKGYASLVNRKSAEVPELSLVVPGDPENSYLWHKLQHTAKEGKGMPRGIFSSRKLPQEQLDRIREWIAQGAQP